MKTFTIVRSVSKGQKYVNGRRVLTQQAIVDFGGLMEPELATRHLRFEPQYDGEGNFVDMAWVGYNTNRARTTRQSILQTFATYKATAETVAARAKKLESDMAELKGKKGVTEDRKKIRETLKTAKAASAMAISDFDSVKAIVDKIDDTHPEFVAFV